MLYEVITSIKKIARQHYNGIDNIYHFGKFSIHVHFALKESTANQVFIIGFPVLSVFFFGFFGLPTK